MRARIRNGIVAAAAASLALAPLAPASAAEPADNCFIHTDDWVRCVCVPVAQLLTKVTGDPWTCA